MNLILNLIAFILIIMGLIFMLTAIPSIKKRIMSNLNYGIQPKDVKASIDETLREFYLKGCYAVILGTLIRIIIVRFSS